jgi:hypothetical protein
MHFHWCTKRSYPRVTFNHMIISQGKGTVLYGVSEGHFTCNLILWLVSWLWRSETKRVSLVVKLVLLSTVHTKYYDIVSKFDTCITPCDYHLLT